MMIDHWPFSIGQCPLIEQWKMVNGKWLMENPVFRGPVYKPGSVPVLANRRRSFFQAVDCSTALAAYPRVVMGRAAPALCLALLPVGFAEPASRLAAGGLLH